MDGTGSLISHILFAGSYRAGLGRSDFDLIGCDPMRILIVHNTLNDSRSVSGVLKEYAHMANAWIDRGHQTDFLVARAGWGQLQDLAPKSLLVNSDGIFDATKSLSRSWLNLPAFAYRILTAHWLQLPHVYDIIYASSSLIVEVYPAIILARRQKAKFVVKIQHVLAMQGKRQGFFDQLYLLSERKCARWINRYADLVLCLSATVGGDYQKFEKSLGLTPRAIIPTGCGIDLGPLSAPSKSPKGFDVVFLGRLHKQKGIFELPYVWAKILDRVPKARLLIIGEGPHRLPVEGLFAEMGLQEGITFTGGISESEKNRWLRQCKVGISLSYEEGWGLSITEFLAAGIPVVAYRLPVFEEVFPEQLQIVNVHDCDAAALKIIALLTNENRRKALGEQGRKFVSRYDHRLIAQGELLRLEALRDAPVNQHP